MLEFPRGTSAALVQFLHQLSTHTLFESSDNAAVIGLAVRARADMREERVDCSKNLLLVDSGLLLQTHFTGTGKQQITGIALPGEIANLSVLLSNQPEIELRAVMGSTWVEIDRNDLLKASRSSPNLMLGLLRESIMESQRTQDWLANIGIRPAVARLAYFLLVFTERLELAGLETEDGCDFPFKQQYLSDALGLSLVHTNRSWQVLNKGGFLSLIRRRLKILDRRGLEGMSQCNPMPTPPSSPRRKM